MVHTRNVVPGDIVRVKSDAYSGSTGAIHNGRMCRVVEVKDGDIIVCSVDDRSPVLTDTHHPPYKLEKKVTQ